MNGYLGEFQVEVNKTTEEWVFYYIERFGQIDGSHHKQWVLDQIARILKGAPVEVTEARWSNGHKELRTHAGTSPAYEAWVVEMRAGEDGPETYGYDVGIPP